MRPSKSCALPQACASSGACKQTNTQHDKQEGVRSCRRSECCYKPPHVSNADECQAGAVTPTTDAFGLPSSTCTNTPGGAHSTPLVNGQVGYPQMPTATPHGPRMQGASSAHSCLFGRQVADPGAPRPRKYHMLVSIHMHTPHRQHKAAAQAR